MANTANSGKGSMSYSFLLGLQIAKHPLSHCDHSTIMICRVDVHCNTSSYPQCYSTAKLSSHVFVYCVSWQILHGTHQRMYALIQKLNLAIIYQLENITCYIIISISDARQSIFWTVVPLSGTPSPDPYLPPCFPVHLPPLIL